jgi:hypothetical protein
LSQIRPMVPGRRIAGLAQNAHVDANVVRLTPQSRPKRGRVSVPLTCASGRVLSWCVVGLLAVFVFRGRVMLGLLALANFMMMGCLVVMVRGRLVMCRCPIMMLAGRMLRRLGHMILLKELRLGFSLDERPIAQLMRRPNPRGAVATRQLTEFCRTF